MKNSLILASLLAAGLTGLAHTASYAESMEKIEFLKINAPQLDMGSVAYPGGKSMKLSAGIGSGAFHLKSDPDDIIYTVSDRGPNVDCKAAKKMTGWDYKKMCGGDKSSKIFPVPSFTPTIYKFKITGGDISLLETITLKDSNGKAVTGLSNPLKGAKTEGAFGHDGKNLGFDPNGVDTEGLVKLADGTFWLCDEYGPSILHVAADGRILERLVPSGLENDYAGATYPVRGLLPSILKKRKLNRGIESIAVSPDEKFLYFAMQSPLANPNATAYKKSANVRVFKFDRLAKKTVGEWVYVMDKPGTFKSDNKKKKRKQSDVKISEMVAVGMDKLLVLERINKVTKFYSVDLNQGTNILAGRWDNLSTTPTLAQIKSATLANAGITPVVKSLYFSTEGHKGVPSKIEGIALMGQGKLVLVNDNDFGIAGDATQILRLTTQKSW